MRQPPEKLDVGDPTPDVFNVRIFLRDKPDTYVQCYDRMAGELVRFTDATIGEDFETETIRFKPEELRLEWIDPRKVSDADLHTDA